MKVQNIKQYSSTYFVSFGYNGAQFNYDEAKITKDITRTATSQSHDLFIEDTNRYRSIPTPKFEDCKFDVQNVEFSEMEGGYRVYTVRVKVTWHYVKE
jgi:hypothetical protein